MEKRWRLVESDGTCQQAGEGLKEELSKGLGVSPIISHLLLNRGIRSLQEGKFFLFGTLRDLHDPFLLPDMEKAVERIWRGLEKNEHILIYGDYDVDGVTATSLLILFFRSLGKRVSYYIPYRLKEGYGLNADAIKAIRDKGVTLIITVDCGISSRQEIEYANSLGIDVIVTDHHEPPTSNEIGESLLPAYAVINPKRNDSRYPFPDLAGVGIAFKLAEAIAEKTVDSQLSTVNCYLDLVALGTIADLAPLTGENRILVREGLKLLEGTSNSGVLSLLEVSGLSGRTITAGNVGFMLAPRINAAGRLGRADMAVRLLTTEEKEEAKRLARYLDTQNKERQGIEEAISREARENIVEGGLAERSFILLSSPDWHQGVIGVVASRIAEEFYRPTVLISMDNNGVGKGSARSIPGLNIYKALSQCASFLDRFGGHKYAAGLTILGDRIKVFQEKMEEVIAKEIDPDGFVPKLRIDAEVRLSEVTMPLAEELNLLSPFGVANPEPTLILRGLKTTYPRLVGKNHLKMTVFPSSGGRGVEAVGFHMGEALPGIMENGGTVDLAFFPQINEWGGKANLQLRLKDIRLQ